LVRGKLSTASSSASGTLLHADSASGTLLHADSASGMLLPAAAGLPLFLRSRKSASGPAPAADFIPDPFTTGLSGDNKLDLLESSELPATARIQQEPRIRGGAMSADVKGGGVDSDTDEGLRFVNDDETESSRGSSSLYDSGEILHEFRAKDTIFYENITIPESEHDNVVLSSSSGEWERGNNDGFADFAKVIHGRHHDDGQVRNGLVDGGETEIEEEIRRRRRHGH
jgi:hypothetical protein